MIPVSFLDKGYQMEAVMFVVELAIWFAISYIYLGIIMRAVDVTHAALRARKPARLYRALLPTFATHADAYRLDSEIISQLDDDDRPYWMHLVSDPMSFALWKSLPALYILPAYLLLFSWFDLFLVWALGTALVIMKPASTVGAFDYLKDYLQENAPAPQKEVMSWEFAKAMVVLAVPFYAYAALYPFVLFANLLLYGQMVNIWFTLALVPVVLIAVTVHKKLVRGVLYQAQKHMRYVPILPPATPRLIIVPPDLFKDDFDH
jgi:hypothetical protein